MSALDYLSGATDALTIGKALLEDPALPQVAKLVLKLRALESTGASSGGPSFGGGKGIGLKNAVKPLELYVKAKEQPILGYAIAVGILAVPFFAGFFVGRSTRR